MALQSLLHIHSNINFITCPLYSSSIIPNLLKSAFVGVEGNEVGLWKEDREGFVGSLWNLFSVLEDLDEVVVVDEADGGQLERLVRIEEKISAFEI